MRRTLFASAAALLAFGLPFLGGVVAWPEIVVPAYQTLRGSLLYAEIFFPHTPLLILLTAAAARLFGFGPHLFAGLVGLSLSATAALCVLGSGRGTRRGSPAFAAIAGVVLLALWVVYFDGPALWPDPFLAPFVLAAALLLERFERAGRAPDLAAAGLVLGLAILVKQTSAWVSLAALAWLIVRSRRRSLRTAFLLAAAVCVPYALFAVSWGAFFGTVTHVRWTLLVPLEMGAAKDNLSPLDLEDLHEVVAPLLGIPALLLARLSLSGRGRLRSALPWLALGCFGMAYPRADLLHLSSTVGLGIVTVLRTVRVLRILTVRRAGRWLPPPRLVAVSASAALVLSSVAVAVLGAGPLALDKVGAPTRFWDDETGRLWDAILARRVSPGDPLVLFNVPYDTLYVRSRTALPGGLYVNTALWDCVNKEGADGRIVAALESAPGTLVLFRETEDPSVRATAIHGFLSTRTELVERVDERTTWRRVAAPPGTGRADPPAARR